MRDDLLDAQAVVDWAVSDLPILQERIRRWRNDTPYRLIGDLDTEPGKKLIRLADVKPVPDIISAEAGVIVHAIRSSLDLLAVALAERNGAVDPTDVYFPIWKDAPAFNDPANRTAEKIKRLSAADQAAIKNLKPYEGGHNHIAALHKLDLTRKHRRLIGAFIAPSAILVSGEAARRGVTFQFRWQGFQDNAIIAVGPAHASESHITIDPEIRFAEPRIVSRKPLIEVLDDFVSLARSIIAMFDTPEI
jgi:hypothetical protein